MRVELRRHKGRMGKGFFGDLARGKIGNVVVDPVDMEV